MFFERMVNESLAIECIALRIIAEQEARRRKAARLARLDQWMAVAEQLYGETFRRLAQS